MSYEITDTKFLSDEEFDQLYKLTTMFMKKEPRDCLFLQLAMFTGARKSEIIGIDRKGKSGGMRVKDFNFKERTVKITATKNSKDRSIPLPEKLMQHLKKYIIDQNLGENDHIFTFWGNRAHEIWCKWRPVKKRFHSLRHTFAVRLYRKTKDIMVVKVALGHRSIMNTQVYVDLVSSSESLRAALGDEASILLKEA